MSSLRSAAFGLASLLLSGHLACRRSHVLTTTPGAATKAALSKSWWIQSTSGISINAPTRPGHWRSIALKASTLTALCLFYLSALVRGFRSAFNARTKSLAECSCCCRFLRASSSLNPSSLCTSPDACREVVLSRRSILPAFQPRQAARPGLDVLEHFNAMTLASSASCLLTMRRPGLGLFNTRCLLPNPYVRFWLTESR